MNLPPNVDHRYDNKYRYRWHRTRPDGTQERPSETFTADTIDEVWSKWAAINDTIRRTQGFVDTGINVATWRDKWLATRQRTREPKTVETDRYRTIQFAAVYGPVKLRDIQPHMIDDFYTELLEDGYAPSTVAGIHKTLRKMFNDAVKKHVLSVNPAIGADVPTVRAKPKTVWTPQQVSAFLDATTEHPMWPLWLIALHTGMRREEYAWLRWGDIDRDRIIVTRRVVTVDGGPVELPATKTGAGRTVTLDPDTAAALHGVRVKQRADLFTVGVRQTDDTPIVAKIDGEPYSPSTITKQWKREVARAGLPHIPLRNTRHTWATIALAEGEEPLVVSERLGHASITITLDMYAQVTARSQQRAAGAMRRAISNSLQPR